MKRPSRASSIRFAVATVVAVAVVASLLHFLPATPPKAVGGSGMRDVSGATSTKKEINPDLPSQSAAVVSELEGSATILRGKDSIPVVLGMAVATEDLISVGESSSLVVTWPHYGRTRFDGGATVTVIQAFESTDRLHFLVRLKLEGGRIWSRFEALFGPTAYFEVRASNTVATVRGTSFGVELTKQNVAIDVMESHVSVFHVHDRPANHVDMVAGIGGMVADQVGEAVDLGPKQKMEVAVDAQTMPSPQAMSADELADPFMQKGNTEMTADELNIVPGSSTPSAGTTLFP